MLRFKLLSAVVFVMPATVALMTQATFVEAAPEECRTKPGSPAPTGSHWYYRIDSVNQRRCWFLSSGDSHMLQTGSLRRPKLISRSTKAQIAQQSELDEGIAVGPAPRREPVALPYESTPAESAAPKFNTLTSQGLVPHKVTSISYSQPRAGEQSFERRANLDLVFLCGGLATALLVAGGAIQVVGRLHRRQRALRHFPTLRQPGADAERQKISMTKSQYHSLPSGRPSQQGGVGNATRRRVQ